MSNDPIYLLVRADDIGCAQAANAACLDVFTKGIARSVEIMAPCAWFPEAVKLLQAHPTYDVGVHLTLTSEWENVKWRPLSTAPSLVDANGYFCHTFWRGSRYPELVPFCDLAWTPADLETEVRAQIELVSNHLPWVSHVSVHMMGLRDNPTFQSVLNQVVADYDLAVDLMAHGFDRFRGFGENSTLLTPAEKVAALRQNLATLTPGKWLHVDHPAYDTPETRAIHHLGYEQVAQDRQGVTEAWTDPEVLDIIARRNIRLVSYGDVKQGKVHGG